MLPARHLDFAREGNGPVVTRSSSTFGMSFEDGSGAKSGVVDLRCASCTKTREASAKRRVAFAAVFLALRRHDPDPAGRVAAPYFLAPAASQPPVGAPLALGDYPQTIPRRSRSRFDDGGSCAAAARSGTSIGLTRQQKRSAL